MTTEDLLDEYADRAGLLEGALENITAMLDGVVTGIVPAAEVRDYARDVLARAGCEQADKPAERFIIGPDGVPYGPFPPAQAGR